MRDKKRLTDADVDRTTTGLIVHQREDSTGLESHEVIEGRSVKRENLDSPWKLTFSAVIPGPADFAPADLPAADAKGEGK